MHTAHRKSSLTIMALATGAMIFAISFALSPSAFADGGKQGGELLWQDQFNGTADGFDLANDIVVQGKRVFVAGGVNNEGSSGDFTVRTYHTKTGELLWQDQFNGTADDSDRAQAIVVQGKRVFVAGSVEEPEFLSAFTVRTYDTKTGKLLWQDQFTEAFSNNSIAFSIAVQGKRVFVVGQVGNDDFTDFTVRTYDAKTGALLWQDQFDGTATVSEEIDQFINFASAIAVRGKRVFVAGTVVNEDTFEDFTVRTYDAKTGALLWQDQFNGTADGFDLANDIAVQGKRVFVAGRVDNQDAGPDFTVRTYDAETGALLWQDQFNGTADGRDSASAIAVRGKRVFVAGRVNNQGTGND